MIHTVRIGDKVAIGQGIKVYVVVSIETGIATLRSKKVEEPLLDVPLVNLVAAP